MKLSEKVKKRVKTPYQKIAEKYGTTSEYVGMVARGKALQIKKELEELVK